MGARNVNLAFTHWANLDDRSFRVLVRMALVSLDDGAPPKYFAGRDDIAAALGKSLPPKPADDDLGEEADADRKARASVHEVVRRAVSKLVNEGAIVSSGDARFGRRNEYSLHLKPGSEAQRSVAPVPNGTLPQQAQQIVAPVPNGTLPQQAQQIVAPVPNGTLEEAQQIVATGPTERCPQGVDEQEEEQKMNRDTGNQSSKSLGLPEVVRHPRELLTDPFSNNEQRQTPADMEAERNRQLAELEKLIGSQKEAS